MPELATIYNRHTGATETLPGDQAALKTYYQRETWSAQPLPPRDWERTVPRYKARWALRPSQFSRHRLEAPWSQQLDSSIWQYLEPGQSIAAGEEVESTAWPAPGFVALNYSAERVIEFYNIAMRSRLANSPWRNGRIELDDGLSGPLPTVTIKSGAAA
jgi:hypothetical protein